MRIDKMPESDEKEAGLQSMQANIHMKGAQLGKVWAELFGLLSKYQAELMSRESRIEITERHLETRKSQFEATDPLRSLENVAKVQEQLEEKECVLSQCRTELSQMEALLKRTQADLSANMDLLDQTRTELFEQRTRCVKCENDFERVKADLNLKDEQIRVKDSLLKKIQEQLMKENAELKEQYLLEKSSLDTERLSHSQTKKLLEIYKGSKRRGSRNNPSVIEIPDSPPMLDLSCDADMLGLSSAIDQEQIQVIDASNSRSDGRRLSTSSSTNTRLSSSADYSTNLAAGGPYSVACSSLPSPVSTSSIRSTYMTPSPSQRLLPIKSFSDSRTRVSHSSTVTHAINSDLLDTTPLSNTEQLLPDIKKDISDEPGVSESSALSLSPIAGSSSGTSMEIGEGQSDTSLNPPLGVKSKLKSKVKLERSASAPYSGSPTMVPFRNFTVPIRKMALSQARTHLFSRQIKPDLPDYMKPHPCIFCGKCFKHKWNLRVHMRIHTGEMPYECSHCGKCFNQLSSMRRHEMSFHRDSFFHSMFPVTQSGAVDASLPDTTDVVGSVPDRTHSLSDREGDSA